MWQVLSSVVITENAGGGPDVDGVRVVRVAEQQFRRAVPEGHHAGRHPAFAPGGRVSRLIGVARDRRLDDGRA